MNDHEIIREMEKAGCEFTCMPPKNLTELVLRVECHGNMIEVISTSKYDFPAAHEAWLAHRKGEKAAVRPQERRKSVKWICARVPESPGRVAETVLQEQQDSGIAPLRERWKIRLQEKEVA